MKIVFYLLTLTWLLMACKEKTTEPSAIIPYEKVNGTWDIYINFSNLDIRITANKY